MTLYSANQGLKFTIKSNFWWDLLFAPFHLKSIPLKSSAKNETSLGCLCAMDHVFPIQCENRKIFRQWLPGNNFFYCFGPNIIMLVEVNSLELFFSKMEKYAHILPHAEYWLVTHAVVRTNCDWLAQLNMWTASFDWLLKTRQSCIEHAWWINPP